MFYCRITAYQRAFQIKGAALPQYVAIALMRAARPVRATPADLARGDALHDPGRVLKALAAQGRGNGAEEGPDAVEGARQRPSGRLTAPLRPIRVKLGNHFLALAGGVQIRIGGLNARPDRSIGTRGLDQRPPFLGGEQAMIAVPKSGIAQRVDDFVIQRVFPVSARAQNTDHAPAIAAGNARLSGAALGRRFDRDTPGQPHLFKLGPRRRVDRPRVGRGHVLAAAEAGFLFARLALCIDLGGAILHRALELMLVIDRRAVLGLGLKVRHQTFLGHNEIAFIGPAVALHFAGLAFNEHIGPDRGAVTQPCRGRGRVGFHVGLDVGQQLAARGEAFRLGKGTLGLRFQPLGRIAGFRHGARDVIGHPDHVADRGLGRGKGGPAHLVIDLAGALHPQLGCNTVDEPLGRANLEPLHLGNDGIPRALRQLVHRPLEGFCSVLAFGESGAADFGRERAGIACGSRQFCIAPIVCHQRLARGCFFAFLARRLHGLGNADGVLALADFQPLHILLQLGALQEARIARGLGEGGGNAALVALARIDRIAFDHANAVIRAQERLDETILDRENLPAPAVDPFGQIAVFDDRVPGVALTLAAPVALLEVARHPRRVQVVHGAQALLHVDAHPQRSGLADHHSDLAGVDRIRDGLLLLGLHAPGDDSNLRLGDAGRDQLADQVFHQAEWGALAGLGLLVVAGFDKDHLRTVLALAVMVHDVAGGAAHLVVGVIGQAGIIGPHVEAGLGRDALMDDRGFL